ncbi:Uncharacterized protein FWK35_00017302 [Aphis craccivora]|uniref:Uncharacterized protein n=1 Tax=Aphis craccivora TaxID=307492 RepID=A0A6G0Y5P9_APHCR|nr:Uncharacterized protein FWK35_00017302 [Aphis craccivora]
MVLSWIRITVSTAKHIISASVLIFSKPFIYRIKNNGPKTVPCGTPCMTDKVSDPSSSVSYNNDREVQSLSMNSVDIDLDLSFMSGIQNLESTLTDTDMIVNDINSSVGKSNAHNAVANIVDRNCFKTASKCMTAMKKTNNIQGILKQIGVRTCKQLTPRCKTFYKMNKLLLRKYRQNSSRKTLFKERLNAAEKFTDEYIVGKYSNMMSATASMFMKLQIRETKKLSKPTCSTDESFGSWDSTRCGTNAPVGVHWMEAAVAFDGGGPDLTAAETRQPDTAL